MIQYQEGHVKHNVETKEVALRTIFPEDQGPQLASMAWLVSTVNTGARSAKTDEVQDWEDVYVPPAPETPVIPQPPVVPVDPS